MVSVQTILVTGPKLAAPAVQMIEQAGYELAYIPAYTEADDMVRRLTETRPVGVISRMGGLDAEAIAASPDLKVISKHGVGVDHIDVAAASARGIPVVIAYGANAVSVAEHALALLLASVKRVVPLDASIRAHRWEKPGFSGRELAGGRLALIGFGAIARRTADLARAFDLDVVAFDPYAEAALFEAHGVARAEQVEDALAGADFVSLHCPLTESTRHMINAERLALVNPGATIVNTARGGLIDEDALLAAVRSGRLAGAGLDTFATEPPPADHPFWAEPSIVLTPHIGGVTAAAGERVSVEAAQNVLDVLAQRPIAAHRVVNRDALSAAAIRIEDDTRAASSPA